MPMADDAGGGGGGGGGFEPAASGDAASAAATTAARSYVDGGMALVASPLKAQVGVAPRVRAAGDERADGRAAAAHRHRL